MKFTISDEFRAKLGKKHLDLAENPPKYGGKLFAHLQSIRRRQRERSERTYQQSRPPKGGEIEYLYFRLIEIFHTEDSERLLDGLLRLFPKLDDDFSQKDFADNFQRQARQIFGGAWSSLGYILREQKQYPIITATSNFRIIPNLPDEVDLIHIHLHQFLPSLFAIALDVHLTPDGAKYISQLQDRRYLSEIRFKRLIPCRHYWWRIF